MSLRYARNVLCSVLLIGLGSVAASSADVVPGYPGALAFYRLNDVDTYARDSSGHGLTAHYGAAVKHGGAYIAAFGDRPTTFPGGAYATASFATGQLDARLQPLDAVTVEASIRAVDGALNHPNIPLVSYGRRSIGSTYVLTISPQNVLQFAVRTTAGKYSVEGYSNVAPGVDYHVAGTFDGKAISIYLNGNLEATLPAAGSLAYDGLDASDGLGIGGALDRGSLQFDGAMSDVAIYGSALPLTALRSDYIQRVLPQRLVERTVPTNALVDAIGVDTHFHYMRTVYDTQFARVKQLLVQSGIRHIRDGVESTKWAPYLGRLNELGAAGIHSTLVTKFGQTPAFLVAYPKLVASTFEAYEAPNEPDVHPVGDWVQATRAFQKMLYTTIKSDPSTSRYAVLGPTPTNLQDYLAVGDLSAYMDVGNFHLYTPGFNPGTDGYGSKSVYGINGSIAWNVNVARIVDGRHGPEVTENGFNYAIGSRGNLPVAIGAKYVPRMVFEMFNHGVQRTYTYQLLDFENVPSFNVGLIGQNLVPKPPYYALQSLIRLLTDPATSKATTTLHYTLSGNLANVHHTLMQRGDGSFELALWVEARSVTPTNVKADGVPIVVAPQPITITLPSTVARSEARYIDERGAIVALPIRVSTTSGSSVQAPASTIAASIGDEITLVHFALR